MKKHLTQIFNYILIIVSIVVLSSCDKPVAAISGEYELSDVVFAGISSSTREDLAKQRAGAKYIIEASAFTIIEGDSKEEYTNISYKRETLDDDLVEKCYATETTLKEMFANYKERYRYSLYDEQGEKIHYYIFQLDEDIYVCSYDRSDILFFWIDKLHKL